MDVSVRLVAVAFDARVPAVVGRFWAGLLGREVLDETRGVLVPGDRTQVGLRFVEAATSKADRNRLHLHVTSASAGDQQATVQRVVELGGRRRGTRPLPIGHDIYLSDAGGNEFCVIEPGNAYLEGCGLLGEVTCEGTRAAGLFWGDALQWPVVWDQGEQIAIQSPAGGTKIAWDGRPDADAPGWNRQRFDLAAPDPGAAAERLLALGATLLGEREGVITLTDPDGSELSIARG